MQRSNSHNHLDIKPDAQLRGTQTSTYNCTWRNSSPFSLARSRRNNRSGIAAAFADRWPSPMMNQMKPRRLFINNGRSVGTARRPGQPVQLQATASVLAPIIYRHATNRIWLAYNHTFICAYSLSLFLDILEVVACASSFWPADRAQHREVPIKWRVISLTRGELFDTDSLLLISKGHSCTRWVPGLIPLPHHRSFP